MEKKWLGDKTAAESDSVLLPFAPSAQLSADQMTDEISDDLFLQSAL
jgi:hypothetical protein